MDKLKKTLKARGDDNFTLFGPLVKLTFDSLGKLISIFAWTDNNSINYCGAVEGAKVDASFADDKARGKVALAEDKCKFDVAFDTPILK